MDDLLWKSQLRKEHRQLLDKVNQHSRLLETLDVQMTTFVTDTNRACERLMSQLNSIEKKVNRLEAEDKEVAQQLGKIQKELVALKASNSKAVQYEYKRKTPDGSLALWSVDLR